MNFERAKRILGRVFEHAKRIFVGIFLAKGVLKTLFEPEFFETADPHVLVASGIVATIAIYLIFPIEIPQKS